MRVSHAIAAVAGLGLAGLFFLLLLSGSAPDAGPPSRYPEFESIPPVELAAWTMVASQILNFDETITKN
jgi:hypothetical protein